MWTNDFDHRLRTGDTFRTGDRIRQAPRWRKPSRGERAQDRRD